MGLLVTDDATARTAGRAGRELARPASRCRHPARSSHRHRRQPAGPGTLTDAKPDAHRRLDLAEQAALAATSARAAGLRAVGSSSTPPRPATSSWPEQASAADGEPRWSSPQTMVIDDVIATTPAKAARKQWFRDYTARYGSYYGVRVVRGRRGSADRRRGGRGWAATDRNRIRDVLETSQIDGLSGPIRITPDNHSGLMPQALTLLVARSGRWRLAS